MTRQLDRVLAFGHYTPGEAMLTGLIVGAQLGFLLFALVVVVLVSPALVTRVALWPQEG